VIDLMQTVRNHPVLAIMRKIPDEDLLDYVQAAIDGGVNFFEVALNTPNGPEQIEKLRKHFGDRILVGAGTVLSPNQAQNAVDHGAQFLLSPSCPEKVLAYCHKNGIAYMPGIMTPSDVGLCLEYGFSTLKLFPANCVSDQLVRQLKGPFDHTEYVAIGGVTLADAPKYKAQGYLGLGVGSNLFSKSLVQARNWQAASMELKGYMDSIRG